MYKITEDKKVTLDKNLMFFRIVKINNFLELERLLKDNILPEFVPEIANSYVAIFSENNNTYMNGFILINKDTYVVCRLLKKSNLDKKTLELVAKTCVCLVYATENIIVDLEPIK